MAFSFSGGLNSVKAASKRPLLQATQPFGKMFQPGTHLRTAGSSPRQRMAAGFRRSAMPMRGLACILMIAAIAYASASAFSQTVTQTRMNCAERAAIVAKLVGYHEEPEAIGLNNDGTLLEVFVSPQGTWTVLVSSPQGQSCIAAIGEAWQLKSTSIRPES